MNLKVFRVYHYTYRGPHDVKKNASTVNTIKTVWEANGDPLCSLQSYHAKREMFSLKHNLSENTEKCSC